MSGQKPSRTKHLGFKPPGVNPAHDVVYGVLEALPRGAASEFVVAAVTEYLANHSGETIGGRKVFILPAAGATGKVPDRPAARKTPQHAKKKSAVATDDTPRAEAALSGVKTGVMQSEEGTVMAAGDTSETPPAPPPQSPSGTYTELDAETLEQLVLGFGNPSI
jgi:hypothetical protein